MKSCPYCSGELEDDAVKCHHCGEWVIKGRVRQKKGGKKGRGPKRLLLFFFLLFTAWGAYAVLSSPGDPVGFLSRLSPQEMVRSELETLVKLEEEYFREHGAYSGNLLALGFSPAPEVAVSVTATPTGWSATATHERRPRTEGCAVYMGTARPPQGPTSPPQPGIVDCTQ